METPDLAQIAALEMRANGFEPVFAPEVLREAERRAQDGPQRSGDIRDLRGRQWFSIDNVDTLDLDQLTWAEAFPDGSVRLPMSRHAPHGIRYSLTLHDKYGTRVLGYDNAHAVKPPKKFKFAGQRLPYEHRHRSASDKGEPYAFESAYRLLEDFFAEVDRVIKEAQQ